MPLEALFISENLTDSDCDGIGEGTGCNFVFFIYVFLRVHTPRHTVFFASNFVCRFVRTV